MPLIITGQINAMDNQLMSNSLFADYPDVVSVTQLQNMLHIGKNTAYQLLKDKEIGYIKIGKSYKIPKINVISFILGVKLM